MKKDMKYMLLALPLLLAACSQDDGTDTLAQKPAQPVSVSISADIEGTRAPLDRTSFVSGDQVSVVICQNDNTLLSWRDFRRSTTWTAVTSATLQPWQGQAQVYGVYPALSESQKAEAKVDAVALDISPVDSQQQDILYGATTSAITAEAPNAKMLFHFALARVTFNISKGQIYDDTDTRLYLTEATLMQKAATSTATIRTKGSLNLKTGNITPDATSPAALSLPANSLEVTTSNTRVEFLVIPADIQEGTVLRLKLNDKYIQVDLPTSPIKAWEKGKQYTYPVKLNYEYLLDN